jgi:hypothetical protein
MLCSVNTAKCFFKSIVLYKSANWTLLFSVILLWWKMTQWMGKAILSIYAIALLHFLEAICFFYPNIRCIGKPILSKGYRKLPVSAVCYNHMQQVNIYCIYIRGHTSSNPGWLVGTEHKRPPFTHSPWIAQQVPILVHGLPSESPCRQPLSCSGLWTVNEWLNFNYQEQHLMSLRGRQTPMR